MSKNDDERVIIKPVFPEMEKIPIWNDIVEAHDTQYDYSNQQYSATMLNDPPRIVHLGKRHRHRIQQPSFNKIGSIIGVALHNYFEECLTKHNKTKGRKDYNLEKRHYMEVLGRKFGSQYDSLRLVDNSLWDYKTCSVSKMMFGNKDSWISQQNLYRMLIKDNEGIDVTSLNIMAVFLDYKSSQLNATSIKKGYPKERIMRIELPIWSREKTMNWLEERVQLMIDHEDTPDDELPECTEEDRWGRSKYKVFHTNNPKRALSAQSKTEKEAQQFIVDHKYNNDPSKFDPKGYSIKFVYGKQVRCADNWCPYAPICNQYQALKKKHGEPRW